MDSIAPAVTASAFGAENRKRLISGYFTNHEGPTPEDAWQHVYRLLLWIDRRTGLAHCYESDKCQPGKPWYSRSLAFHDWVSKSLGASPSTLAGEIDYLFRRVIEDLALAVLHSRETLTLQQREPYEGRGFPEPGDDPELLAILEESLEPYLAKHPSEDFWQTLVQRIQQHMTQANKRQNLLGEGFEDVLSSVIERSVASKSINVFVRQPLGDLPGFRRTGEGKNAVDLALIRDNRQRMLVTAKWSFRTDREKQIKADYDRYIAAKSDNRQFDYVLITNEFDPARLKSTCEHLEGNALMLTHVVHINTDALLATYGVSLQGSAADVVKHIERGRLISLATWLSMLKE